MKWDAPMENAIILPLNEKVVNSTVTLQRNSTDVAHFIQFDRT